MATAIKYVLSIVFTLAGGVKVCRAKPMVDQFKEFGLPNIAVAVVGTLEVLGAIGLWISPRLTGLAALGLLVLMVGAVFNHLKVKHPFKSYAPALVLGLILIVYLSLIYI